MTQREKCSPVIRAMVAKESPHPPGLLDLRRAQQGSARFPHVHVAMPNAKESTRSCSWLLHLHRARQGTARLPHVHVAMPNAKESTRSCPWLLHLRHARQGTARLPDVHFPMPDAKESSRSCSGLLYVHHARQGTARLPHVHVAMPNAKESTRSCSELSYLHHAPQESGRLSHVQCATPDSTTRPRPSQSLPPHYPDWCLRLLHVYAGTRHGVECCRPRLELSHPRHAGEGRAPHGNFPLGKAKMIASPFATMLSARNHLRHSREGCPFHLGLATLDVTVSTRLYLGLS